ncbi:uncharacterized protein LOC114971874 [Acropora millepora]|uniref:uncharacterized protein LOC114971874 n=1 Tax=Acropora millepora TaxID=45264 RepID=UPI001CF3B648|nr:uncharacterized protein LOC114971874 [Acropora millepora]
MTYTSLIGSLRSNTYSILISKFCSFASVRRGGKMFCDVVFWVELVKDFYAAVWLTAKGNKTYLFFSKTEKDHYEDNKKRQEDSDITSPRKEQFQDGRRTHKDWMRERRRLDMKNLEGIRQS